MIVNGAMSASLSAVANVDKPNVLVQAVVSSGSSPVGTLKVQVTSSRDLSSATWDDLPGTSVAISADGTTSLNLSGLGANGIKVVYTRSSGDGILNVNMSQN
jgi:hypothetical protein